MSDQASGEKKDLSIAARLAMAWSGIVMGGCAIFAGVFFLFIAFLLYLLIAH